MTLVPETKDSTNINIPHPALTTPAPTILALTTPAPTTSTPTTPILTTPTQSALLTEMYLALIHHATRLRA